MPSVVLITVLLNHRASRLFVQLISTDDLSLFGLYPGLDGGVFQGRCLDNVSYSLCSRVLHLLKMFLV